MSSIKSKMAYVYCADWTLRCINFHKIGGISCWLSAASCAYSCLPSMSELSVLSKMAYSLCRFKFTLCKLSQDRHHCCSLIRVMAVLTEVPIYQTAWHHIPGKCNLDGVHQETPRSHKNNLILGYVYIFTAIHFLSTAVGMSNVINMVHPVVLTYIYVVYDYMTFIRPLSVKFWDWFNIST
jgi:hypothetical protein